MTSSPARGIRDQLGGSFDLKLFFDVRSVNFDGFCAKVQLFGHLARALAGADKLKNFELAIAQLFDRRMRGIIAASREYLQNFRRHLLADAISPASTLRIAARMRLPPSFFMM